MDQDIKNKAVAVCDGMREIARNEMLTRGVYVTDEIVRVDLAEAGAICGGHQACAVGSMLLAAGVRRRWRNGDQYLPGADVDARADYLRRHPHIQAAYDALNEAAERYCKRHNIDLGYSSYVTGQGTDGEGRRIITLSPGRFGAMESLFEATYYTTDEPVIEFSELPKIITSAKRALLAA